VSRPPNTLACPACASQNVSVVETRGNGPGSLRRRRVCDSCGHRWSTIEISEAVFKSLARGDGADHRAKILRRIAQELQDLAQ